MTGVWIVTHAYDGWVLAVCSSEQRARRLTLPYREDLYKIEWYAIDSAYAKRNLSDALA